MDVLLTVTLVYAAILVLALAVSLIAIWVYLRRVAQSLGEVRRLLSTVRDRTEPLEEPLQRVQDSVGRSSGDMMKAMDRLARADTQLEHIAERLGAISVTRE